MKREITRRDVHAELIHPSTLVRAMEFRRIGPGGATSIRQFARNIGVTNQMLSQLRTGQRTRCTPELARLIEEGLDLEQGSLFVLKVKSAAQRSKQPTVQEAGSEEVA